MIRRIQEASEAWRVAVYGPRSLEHRTLKLVEETSEVAQIVTRVAEGRPSGNIAHELADVVIAACAVASEAGVDLETAIEKRWHVIKERR